MGKILNIQPNFFFGNKDDDHKDNDDMNNYMEFLPSVDFGPIDIDKSLKILNWKPTLFYESLKETCIFFEKAWYLYPELIPLEDFHKSMIYYLKKKYYITNSLQMLFLVKK